MRTFCEVNHCSMAEVRYFSAEVRYLASYTMKVVNENRTSYALLVIWSSYALDVESESVNDL